VRTHEKQRKEKPVTVPQKAPTAGEVMESVIIKGDLKNLTPEERVSYFNEVCKSIGLNPLTRPLEYMELSGRLILYAKRDAADQLRKMHGVNVEIVSQDYLGGMLSVHVRARDKTGRTDEDLGVVNFPDGMRGDIRANTVMKAVTKAKRRVTLSICGLGFLDETEVEDIPGAAKKPKAPAPDVMLQHDPSTGEIADTAAAPPTTSDAADAAPPPNRDPGDGAAASLEDQAREAARKGEIEFRTFWRNCEEPERKRINAIGDQLRELMTKSKEPT
jgi:hypothetical protein